MFQLQPQLKTRNELTAYFTSFICKRYKTEERYSVFNVYQDQQRSLFERFEYWTYDDTLKNEFKGRNAKFIFNGEKGILVDAYGTYSDPDVDQFIKQVEEISKKTHVNSSI